MLTRNLLLDSSRLIFTKLSGVDPNLGKNVLAMQKLDKIFNSLTRFYPYSSSALDPASLNLVICDILVNSRRNIVELGSGVSTVILAKMLEMNDITAKFHSIDSDEDWANLVSKYLEDEGLSDRCEVHFVPLSKNGSNWYDEELIAKLKPQIASIDCLLVDGPIAYLPEIRQSRVGALVHLRDLLKSRHSIFLDDALRQGEQEVLSLWKSQFGIDFRTIGSIAVHLSGSHYNIE